jgi:hypothetical protein
MLQLASARHSLLAMLLALALVAACSSDDGSGASSSAGASGAGGSSAQTTGNGGSTTTASAQSGSGMASNGQGGSAGGGSGDTWGNYAMGFFATYCVECHGAGDALRDYTTIDDVKLEQAEIRCGVASTMLSGCGSSPAPKQFPISNAGNTNAKPDDPERDRLVAWIEAGLPE